MEQGIRERRIKAAPRTVPDSTLHLYTSSRICLASCSLLHQLDKFVITAQHRLAVSTPLNPLNHTTTATRYHDSRSGNTSCNPPVWVFVSAIPLQEGPSQTDGLQLHGNCKSIRRLQTCDSWDHTTTTVRYRDSESEIATCLNPV